MQSSSSVAIKYGLIISVILIGYFLLLKLFGLHNNPWFRLFNGAVMAYGIYASIKYFKSKDETFSYTDGFKTGLMTGFLATAVFTAFMSVYMFHFDVEFMNHILKNWIRNENYGGGLLIFIILIEGLSSAVVLTLAFMQLFKNSRNMPQNK